MSIDINAFNKALLNRQNDQTYPKIDSKIYEFIIKTNRYSLQLDKHDAYGEPIFKRLMTITRNGQKLIKYVDMIRSHEEFDVLKRFYQLQIMEIEEQSDIKLGDEIRKNGGNFIQQHVGYIEGCYNCIKCSFELYLSFRQLLQKQHVKLILDLLFYPVYKQDYISYMYYTLSKKPKQIEIQFIDPSISKTLTQKTPISNSPMFCDSYEYYFSDYYDGEPYMTNNSTRTAAEYYLYSENVLTALWRQIYKFLYLHEESCKTKLILHRSIHHPEIWIKCQCCERPIYTLFLTYYKCCNCYCCPICLVERLIPFYGDKLKVKDPFKYALALRQCPVCKKDQGYIMYVEYVEDGSEYYCESSSSYE